MLFIHITRTSISDMNKPGTRMLSLGWNKCPFIAAASSELAAKFMETSTYLHVSPDAQSAQKGRASRRLQSCDSIAALSAYGAYFVILESPVRRLGRGWLVFARVRVTARLALRLYSKSN